MEVFSRKILVLVPILLALAGCAGTTTQRPTGSATPPGPATPTAPHTQAPTSATGWTVPDPALADMFPAVPGFNWGQMSAAVLERNVKIHYADFGERVQGADIRYVLSGGNTVGIVSVLALAPAYASSKAAAAELHRQAGRAAKAYGVSYEGAKIGGHNMMGFTTNGLQNWYWVSGKTIVSVITRYGEAVGDKFLKLYAARTP